MTLVSFAVSAVSHSFLFKLYQCHDIPCISCEYISLVHDIHLKGCGVAG